MAKNNIDDLPIKLLSVAYLERKQTKFAYCPNCKEIFEDDMPSYGSLLCPRCDYALLRGLTKIDIVNGQYQGYPIEVSTEAHYGA